MAESPGVTGLEADVDACHLTPEALEWWHPFRRFASYRCTNCGVDLEQEYPESSGTAANNNNNSDAAQSPFVIPTSGKGGCSRCHRAYYCSTEVC